MGEVRGSKPHCTLVCGPPGCGKSTYGRLLAAKTGACLLDIDVVTQRLVCRAMKESGHDENDRDSDCMHPSAFSVRVTCLVDFKRTFRDEIYET